MSAHISCAVAMRGPSLTRRAPRKARPDLSEYASADPKAFIAGKVNSIQSCAPPARRTA